METKFVTIQYSAHFAHHSVQNYFNPVGKIVTVKKPEVPLITHEWFTSVKQVGVRQPEACNQT